MKHLFILCSGGSGSWLLHHCIKVCEEVQYLKGPGSHRKIKPDQINQHNIENIELYLDVLEGDKAGEIKLPEAAYYHDHNEMPEMNQWYFQDESKYNWEKIKKRWNKLWNLSQAKGGVRLQKNMCDIFRTKILNKQFENLHFLLLYRNPCVYIHRSLQRSGSKFKLSLSGMMEVQKLQYLLMLDIYQTFFDRSLLVKYEDICSNNITLLDDIKNMIPELCDLSFDHYFAHPYEQLSLIHRTYTPEHVSVGLEINQKYLAEMNDKHKSIIETEFSNSVFDPFCFNFKV